MSVGVGVSFISIIISGRRSVCDTITPGFGTACHSLRLHVSAVDLLVLTCAAIIIRLAQLELFPVAYNHPLAGLGFVPAGVHCGNCNEQCHYSVLKYECNANSLLDLHHNAR